MYFSDICLRYFVIVYFTKVYFISLVLFFYFSDFSFTIYNTDIWLIYLIIF